MLLNIKGNMKFSYICIVVLYSYLFCLSWCFTSQSTISQSCWDSFRGWISIKPLGLRILLKDTTQCQHWNLETATSWSQVWHLTHWIMVLPIQICYAVTILKYSSLVICFVFRKYEPRHEISNNVVCATRKASDQPAHMRSLIRAFASRFNILCMSVKLLTEHRLEFLSMKGDCTGLSEYTLVKMPHCWKLHLTAQLPYQLC